MKNSFMMFVLVIFSSDVFAYFEIKVKALNKNLYQTFSDVAQIHALSQIDYGASGPSQDVHVLKISGNVRQSDGNVKFETNYLKVTFSSNVTFSIDDASIGEFIDAQIAEQLQKELSLFSPEIHQAFVSGNSFYSVVSISGPSRDLTPSICSCGTVTVTVWGPEDPDVDVEIP